MKIAFFWTPSFAADILSGILTYDDIEVSLVVSQPDKPVGRKKELTITPVKKIAQEHAIEVQQPIRLKDNTDFETTLRDLELDFIVVVAYGKIIPQSILSIPKHGCINLHGSILPLYRGASPVQSAIADGRCETWLTTMYMNARMDEGDVLKIAKIDVDKDDTSPDIFQKFTRVWPDLLCSTLTDIIAGTLSWTPQEHDHASYCHMIQKIDGEVSFSEENANQIYDKFRAFQPWPWVYTYIGDKKLGLESISFETLPRPLPDRRGVGVAPSPLLGGDREGGLVPWLFLKINKRTYGVVCADKEILLLHQVKPEWKKSMDIVSFVNGNRELFQ